MLNEAAHLKNLKIKREQSLKILTKYLKKISKCEQSTEVLDKLIKKSRKRYKKAMWYPFKRKK